MTDYFPENEFSHRDIKAAIDSGQIKPWRVDAGGRQWYKRIEAIPPAAERATTSGKILGGIKKMIFGIPSDATATAANQTGTIHGTPSGPAEF